MTQYIVRRLLTAIPTLVLISMAVFAIVALAPGDPLAGLATNPDVPAEVRQNILHQMGLDQPLPIRYVKWAESWALGNWGYSFGSHMAVTRLLMQRLPTDLWVLGSAYLLAVLIAIPVGVISAVRQYSLSDQIATTAAFVGYSLPTFFTGILMIIIFSVRLRWLPFIYNVQVHDPIGIIKQTIMPVAVLALFQSASLTRFVRSSMLDNVGLDYVRTARAKGLAQRKVILRHVLRNSLIPVVTLIALQLPGVFTGAVVTEQIFRVPGIGSLLISSLQNSDTPVLMAIAFVAAILVVLLNLVADVIYGTLDPRIRYG
ncbi:MAG TPA: ABC transporter permease [bacterium]|jgi:peptide/nickel transport system permease protein|nr:ABC transporter permease [bacterium]